MSMLAKIRKVVMPFVWQRHLMANVAEQNRRAALDEMRRLTPDNPCLKGFKAFSQTDEDGCIEEIFRRLGGGQTFVEIGCGDGLENNTHYLLLKGWSGMWVDGSATNMDVIRRNLPRDPERLTLRQQFIDTDNIRSLAATSDVDFLSMDVDGNDLHLLRSYLTVTQPKVICAEYNAKFRPPLAVSVAYDAGHCWGGDDYMGASLAALVEGLDGYTLVGCGIAGLNAYFVRNDLAGAFTSYPVGDLYQPFRIALFHPNSGHPSSYKFLANSLRERSVPVRSASVSLAA